MKALIAMSGGIDSSVAAFLIKERGYDCIGVTMKLFCAQDITLSENHPCCTEDDIKDARGVADLISIEHSVIDFSDDFISKVVRPFADAYENAFTPNPCIECNRHLKFEALFRYADSTGCDKIVTGHYVSSAFDPKSGRYILKKALDASKDQSYVLYSLSQKQLSRVIFPMGDINKEDARALALKKGFINASKRDSQDICFIPDGKYAEFIENFTKKKYPEGNFVDTSGRILGTHKGIIRYTIGQRKGLGVSFGEPMYVIRIDRENNSVVLGKHEELFSKKLIAKDINLISIENLYMPMRVKAKIRYRQEEQWATAVQTDDDTLSVEFDEPQRAVTRGQSVVLYDGDTVVGGGIIQ